jgi:hypothetical protein
MTESRTPFALNGIQDLIPFLNYLKDRKIHFGLRHTSFETLTVEIYLPGLRIEVDFHNDRVDYGIFSGDESVLEDHKGLFDILDED